MTGKQKKSIRDTQKAFTMEGKLYTRLPFTTVIGAIKSVMIQNQNHLAVQEKKNAYVQKVTKKFLMLMNKINETEGDEKTAYESQLEKLKKRNANFNPHAKIDRKIIRVRVVARDANTGFWEIEPLNMPKKYTNRVMEVA